LVPLSVLLFLGRGEASDSAPCEDWLASEPCDWIEFGEIVDCSLFFDIDCDTSGYFNCLEDVIDDLGCDEETRTEDLAGWSICDALLEEELEGCPWRPLGGCDGG